MTEPLVDLELKFTGGLVNQPEVSTLPADTTVALDNFEVGINGGLRARRQWKLAIPTGGPTVMQGRGLTADFVYTGTRKVVGAWNDTGVYKLFQQDYGTGQLQNVWSGVENVTPGSLTTLPLAFAAGASVLLYSHPGLASGRIRKWTGAAVSDAATDAIAGRALVYNRSRFFSGGDLAQPTWLRWSEVNDPATWLVTENFIPVQQDDGEPIEDIAIFDRGLIVGKQSSVHFLSGATPDAYQVDPLTREHGVAPGRSILPTPDGVYMVTPYAVFFWNGASSQLISRYINFQVTGAFVTTAMIENVLHICDSGGVIWCYDTERHIWWTEETTPDVPTYLETFDRYEYVQPRSGTGYPARYRDMVYGTRGTDIGAPTTFIAQTEQKWLNGPLGTKVAVKSIYLRYRNLDDLEPLTTLTIYLIPEEGETVEIDVDLETDGGVHQVRLDTGIVCRALSVELVVVSAAGEDTGIDIEAISLGMLPERSRR